MWFLHDSTCINILPVHYREIRFIREKRFADFVTTINNNYAPFYIMYKGAAGSRFRTTATVRDVGRGPREKADGEACGRSERATAAGRRWKWRPKAPPIGRHYSLDLYCRATSLGDPSLSHATPEMSSSPFPCVRTHTHVPQPPHNIHSPSPPLPRADFVKFNEFNTRLAIINPRFN